MRRFAVLENASFTACMADNEPLGIHRPGYNGLSSLIPRDTGNNLFVPTYAGLNYETISLTGMPPYRAPGREDHQAKFEPRCEPMHVDVADSERVVLVQPPTRHAGVSARIEFRVAEPHYLHQRIELTFHKRFCPEDRPSVFTSLWASYLHMPPDGHLYLQPEWRSRAELAGWIGLTKAGHGVAEYQIRRLPEDRRLQAMDHLAVMEGQAALRGSELAQVLSSPLDEAPLPFYYGLCHDQLFLMMFRQPEQITLAYSPTGGGTEPAWCPAWDYVLRLADAPPGTTHVWDLCLVVKEFQGREDVLAEVQRYLA